MSSVPYVSSGGIRALHAAYKVLKRKNGQLILAGTGEFSKKVLELSGFDRIFPQFPTIELAVKSIESRSLQGTGSTEWKTIPGIPGSTMIIRNHPVSDGKAVLVSSGPWKEVQQSGLKPDDLLPVKFRDDTFAICIGAFGPSTGESFRVVGDMIAAGKMIAWTSPGSCAADYVLHGYQFQSGQQDSLSEIPGVFSACSFALEGDIHEVLLVEPGTGADGKITLGDVHAVLCSHAKERGSHHNGIIAVKILAQTCRYDRLVLEKAPVEANRPLNREPIWSKDNYEEWFGKSLVELKEEGTLVSFGVLYDSSVESGLDPEIMSSFFPGNYFTNGQNIFSHTLGISFNSVNWKPDDDIDRAIMNVESEGEVTGMCRLNSSTGLTRALIGVSYIDCLRLDDGPVIVFEEPCPEWTEQYENITRQLHQGSKKIYLSRISGGFSGSLVFRAVVIDRAGRKQMPFVMKLGPWSMISDEVRGYTEYVERYILNSSTRLIQHRKAGESGGILYNFVGIGDTSGSLVSLEDYYQSQSPDHVEDAFDRLFRIVLKSWYGQPARREIALYQEYRKPPMYEKSREYALSHFCISASDPEIDLPCNLGRSINPLYFIEHVIPSRMSATSPAYFAPAARRPEPQKRPARPGRKYVADRFFGNAYHSQPPGYSQDGISHTDRNGNNFYG